MVEVLQTQIHVAEGQPHEGQFIETAFAEGPDAFVEEFVEEVGFGVFG